MPHTSDSDPLLPLSVPAMSVGDAEPGARTPPEAAQGPRYTPGNVLGEGGMGRVRVAWDHVLGREVALKEPAQGAGVSPGLARRLAREAWITAQLDHPGIVAVHDAGRLPDGSPFYTMRLVRGRTLGAALAEAPDLRARLGLVRNLLAACEAVAYAHEAGIVHRDLKPANILVGRHGETQVVDWGLARVLAEPEGPEPGLRGGPEVAQTQLGAVVGTPAFMSPEAARGEPADRRSDVWSLGAVLYALLTGRAPYEGPDSDAVTAAVRAGPPPPAVLRAPGVPADLSAVAARAMAFQAEDRYPDASALAEDLAAWFEGRQVVAHDYSSRELLTRFFRAWRVPLVVAGLGLLAITLAVGVGWQRTRTQRDRALQAEREASTQRGLADRNLAHALVERASDALRSDERAEAEVLAAHALALEPSPEALGVLAGFARAPRPRLVSSLAAPACTWVDLSADQLLCGEERAVSSWAIQPLALRWRLEEAATTGELDASEGRAFLRMMDDLMRTVDARTGATLNDNTLPWEQYGAMVAQKAASEADTALLSAARLRRRRGPEAHPCDGFLRPIAFSSRRAAMAGLCADGVLWAGPVDAREVPVVATPFRDEAEASALAFTADDRGLVVGTIRGQVALLDSRTGEILAEANSDLGMIRQLRVSEYGMVGVLGSRGQVRVWSPAAGAWVFTLPGGGAKGLAWDGEALLVLGGALQRWALPVRPVPGCLHTHDGVASVSVSPDGELLAIAQGGGWLRVVSLPDGVPVLARRLDEGVIKGVAFSPDGRWLASASVVGAFTQRWAVGAWSQTAVTGSPRLRRVGWLGGELVGAAMGQGAFFWGEGGQRLVAPSARFADMAGSPGGEALAWLDLSGQVWTQRAGEGEPHVVVSVPRAVAVDVAADARTLVVAREDGLALLDGTGATRLEIPAPRAEIRAVALSPDGRTVAAGGLDNRARVWSTSTGALLLVLAGHTDRVSALAYGPDSRWLVTGSWDRTVRLWDLDVLEQDPATLAEAVEGAWQLELDDLLDGKP